MKKIKYWSLIKQSARNWNNDNATSLAASLAYYTVFSLAPLLVICIAIAGLIFGKEAAQGEILGQFGTLLGPETAQQIQTMLKQANQESRGVISTIIGAILLIVTSSGVFGELRTSLNIIWKVPPQSQSWLDYFRSRFLSFAMVVVVGFLLLVSLVLSSLLTALSTYVSSRFAFLSTGAEALNFIVSLGFVTLLFALIFKLLPNIHIQWREVWLGALVTALLFTLGKSILGVYLGISHASTAYGAAGSLVVILIWVYYSAQILYFGAELTRAHAVAKGKKLTSMKNG